MLEGKLAVPMAYMRAVEKSGGFPVVLWPTVHVTDTLALLDGLLLSGGDDVDPALYGQEPHEKTDIVARERDEFEIALARLADEIKKPVLGICRGEQVVNVAFGGTLIQHIPDAIPGSQHFDPEMRHDAEVTPGSFAGRALHAQKLQVNSTHHQSVDRVAPGFTVTARASDGVIEGIERGLIWCVQWHPERMGAEMSPLFQAFSRACAERSMPVV